MTPPEIDHFFSRLANCKPDPRSELDYVNPYTLLVAVVLSAQATDAGVNKATKALFQIVQTPNQMIALGETTLRDYVKTIGLYNTKAKHIIALSHILINDHDGQVPEDRAILETLPGVGRKTAAVVLNVAFGHPLIPVDTHIFRVSNRTGLAIAKTADAVEARLTAIVPDRWKPHAHHWLILHGRYVCKARKPECHQCVVADLCGYDKKAD